MIKLKCSFKDTIKNFILNHPKLKKYYTNTFPNSKYSLDIIIEDILFVLKSGVSWRDTRSIIKWQSLFWHFQRFSKFNVFKSIFYQLRNLYSKQNSIELQIIDSTFIMNKFGKNKIARNKFFKNKNCNKISVVSDSHGIPLSVLINTGNVHDLSFVENHVSDLLVVTKKINSITLLADKGYVSRKLKESVKLKNYDLIYPKKKNMAEEIIIDSKLYKKRINVEHTFQKLKLFKRIQLRYDSKISSFHSFVFIACSLLIYRGFQK